MTTITDRILKFKPMIKKSIAAKHKFFVAVTFSRINSIAYINSIIIQHLQNPFIKNQFQKDCHQDILSFACLQFYKQSCLNILAGNIFICYRHDCKRLKSKWFYVFLMAYNHLYVQTSNYCSYIYLHPLLYMS